MVYKTRQPERAGYQLAMKFAGLGLMSALILSQACERPTPKVPTPAQPDVAAKQADLGQPADAGADAAPKKPGKAELPKDGSITPKDVGPPAPALMIMTGLKGYTEPCGCTLDIMLGGIDRIVGYIEAARSLYPDTAIIDAGDLLFEEAEISASFEPMERRKVELLMQAHKRLGTKVTVPGHRDFALGADFYETSIAKAGIEPLGVNIKLKGKAIKPWTMLTLKDQKIALIGVAEPELYKDIKTSEIEVREDKPAFEAAIKAAKAQSPDAIIALYHGKGAGARALLEANPSVNFAVIGVDPRETDQVDQINQGFTLEPHDQGRYLGILKLYPSEGDATYQNASTGSKTELETVQAQLQHVEASISKLPPAAPGQEPPLLKGLRKRLGDLKEQERQLKVAKIEVPQGASAFIWRSVPMEPGLPIDEQVQAARVAYNRANKADAPDLPVPPVKPDEAFYVGNAQCQQCHVDAAKFWATTNHSHAFETLVTRDKDFDPKCVSCHVVGYEKPGGSVVGKTQYEVPWRGETLSKDLRDVGCENCHGPGSKHIESIFAGQGPQHIQRAVTEQTCMGTCHVPEHSPRFNFERYRQLIVGPGHGQPKG